MGRVGCVCGEGPVERVGVMDGGRGVLWDGRIREEWKWSGVDLGGGCGGGMLSERERERMLGVSMAGVRCSKVCLDGEGVVRRARG